MPCIGGCKQIKELRYGKLYGLGTYIIFISFNVELHLKHIGVSGEGKNQLLIIRPTWNDQPLKLVISFRSLFIFSFRHTVVSDLNIPEATICANVPSEYFKTPSHKIAERGTFKKIERIN